MCQNFSGFFLCARISTKIFILFQTFIFLILAFIIFIKFCIIIETSAEVRRYKEDNRIKLDYEDRIINDVAHVFNAITFAWFTQFIYGCQHFVIADTIVQWYFTPDKEKIRSPILTSFKNLVRYHLGSICLGASLITIVKVVKTIVELIRVILDISTNISQFYAFAHFRTN